MRTKYWSGKKIGDLKTHFWNNVHVSHPDDCWEWKLSRYLNGYGAFYAGGRKIAHRVAYELTFGPIPHGLVVMHTCDNRPCCNPAHLAVGTAKDNIRDCMNKGRFKTLPGTRNHQAKLSEDKVLQIRELRRCGLTFSQLAANFGINRATIHSIVHRRTWIHI